MKYKIEKNSVQETLVIPLYGRKLCNEKFPELFQDPDADRIIDMLDYDATEMEKKAKSTAYTFGALEVAARQTDLAWEVGDYLKAHPACAVVNLGCGLDTSFSRLDNGQCSGYNFDFPDVIETRNALIPPTDREKNIACDLNDFSWMDAIEYDPTKGAAFFAAGVFYYFKKAEIKKLLTAMAEKFPGAMVCFDSCGPFAVKLMMKGVVKGQAGIDNVDAFFSTKDPDRELAAWSDKFEKVSSKGYMLGYLDLGKQRWIFRTLAKLGDGAMKMKIVRIDFSSSAQA